MTYDPQRDAQDALSRDAMLNRGGSTIYGRAHAQGPPQRPLDLSREPDPDDKCWAQLDDWPDYTGDQPYPDTSDPIGDDDDA